MWKTIIIMEDRNVKLNNMYLVWQLRDLAIKARKKQTKQDKGANI